MTKPKTLYVCRPLLNAGEFIKWAKGEGFKTALPPDEMHVTLIYSKTPLKWPEPIADEIRVTEPDERSVEPLGDGGAIVLKFRSPTLELRWKDLIDAGAVSDYPTYTPHVTITFQGEGVDLAKVKPFAGELVFGPEVFDTVTENFQDTFTEKKDFAKNQDVSVLKVDEGLGIVFGWAIVSKENGVDYYDLQGDHIPEESMLKAAADFMVDGRVAKEMHVGDQVGTIVFAWPMTSDIAGAMGFTTKRTGLMIGMKPGTPEMLQKFRDGTYTGFSIGGSRLKDEEVA